MVSLLDGVLGEAVGLSVEIAFLLLFVGANSSVLADLFLVGLLGFLMVDALKFLDLG